jgi:hypothetical protein
MTSAAAHAAGKLPPGPGYYYLLASTRNNVHAEMALYD